MQRGEVTWQGDEQRDAYGRGSRDPPECWLGLWQAPVLSVIPPALVKRDRIHHQLLSPSPHSVFAKKDPEPPNVSGSQKEKKKKKIVQVHNPQIFDIL